MFETTDAPVSTLEPETIETTDFDAVAVQIEADEDAEREYIGQATYSLQDNKLRFYPFRRLSPTTYARVKAAGFSWAPKQELFVAGMWTPQREDLLVELCGDIEDEDITPEERAADRADRFSEYSGNANRRASAAHRAVESICDGIPLGQPILVGHHSERHARRDQERIQNGMRKVVQEMKRTEYWRDRASASLAHAKYLEKPAVRARRIKTIEADKRKAERNKAEAADFVKLWTNPDQELTRQRAKGIANYDHISMCFPLAEYPRDLPASQYEGSMGLWSALDDGIITPEQARDLAVPAHRRTIAWSDRWIAHYENRLVYERTMLGEQGGLVTDRVKPEKGGAVRSWAGPGYGKGWSYIRKVNKVSVTIDDVADYAPAGGKPRIFKRTMPFDKLTAVMSQAQVEEARARNDGSFAETAFGDGFFLSTDPVSRPSTKVEPPAWKAIEEAANNVQAVVAPELFPTPPELAARMVEEACIGPEDRVLEPSAGTGNLVKAIRQAAPGAEILAVELNAAAAQQLQHVLPSSDPGYYAVFTADFIDVVVEGDEGIGTFDRVVMNPPFSDEIAHVRRAFGFLKPGGRLVAIMSEGPFFRSYNADKEFRTWLEEVGGVSEQLPPDSFKASETGVNTRLVTIAK